MARVAIVIAYAYQPNKEGFRIGSVKCDLGGGRIITASHYASPGENDHPFPGDFCALEPKGTGGFLAVAFWDPKLQLAALPGEKILMSRSAPGVPAAKIHMRADGSVVINDTVTISALGAISALGEVTAMAETPLAVRVSTHLHLTAVGPTNPPTPGT